jgi:hypothetical protein
MPDFDAIAVALAARFAPAGVTPPPATSYRAAVVGLGPAGYWRLGEAAGAVAVDEVGAGPGTYVAAPALGVAGALAGDVNTAAAFNGTTQYVSVADQPFVVGQAAMSVSFWIKTTVAVTVGVIEAGMGASRWRIEAEGSGKMRIVKAGAATTTATVATNDGLWHHAVLTSDGAITRWYLDGVARGTGVDPNGVFHDPAGVFRIAAYVTGATFLPGSLDEVAIWDRVLTPAEVAALYLAGTETYDPIRLGTADLPGQMTPLPTVLVFPSEGSFRTGNGMRQGGHDYLVRFYYNQAGDLERDTVALRKWLTVLVDQLRDATMLGGLVTVARVVSWKIGDLPYAGAMYSGIELGVHVVSDEGWAAVA